MADSNAFRRSKTLRENINRHTGYNDLTVTEGVKRLLTNVGTDKLVQNEANTMHDEFPDPMTPENEFGRLFDYGNDFHISEDIIKTYDIPLRYLENSSKTKVDTNFIPDVKTDKMHIIFEIVEGTTQETWPGIAALQTLSNGNGANFGLWYTRSNHTCYGQNYEGRIFDIWTGKGIDVTSLSDDGRNITGNIYTRTTEDPFYLGKKLMLFYRNNNTDGLDNTNCYGIVRIYECEIYRNDVLIHRYVPKVSIEVCRSTLPNGQIKDFIMSEKYGFYDEIDKIWLSTLGSDPLRKGPYVIDLEEDYIFKSLEYLQFTSSQVIYTDFVIQGNQKFNIDIDLNNNYGTGISSYNRSGFSSSVLNTRTSGKIKIGYGDQVDNKGRGIFSLNYPTGEWSSYESSGQIATPLDVPNYYWYMFGCWYELGVEYYHMTAKLYGFELYDDSIDKVKDLKPMEIVSLGDYIIGYGLYDSINNLLYVSGKGTLQKGPYIN